jgi:hypothetical protein
MRYMSNNLPESNRWRSKHKGHMHANEHVCAHTHRKQRTRIGQKDKIVRFKMRRRKGSDTKKDAVFLGYHT